MSGISTPYYKALDFTLIFLACSLAYWVRFDTFALPLYYLLPTTIFAGVSTLSLGITNFYQPINSNYSTKQGVAAISGLTVAAVLTTTCLYLTKTGEDYSRIWMVTSVILACFALITARYLLKRVFHVSTNPRVIVLLGGGNTADSTRERIESFHGDGISIAKHFTNTQSTSNPPGYDLASIAQYVEEHRQDPELRSPITEIWITHDAFSRHSHQELLDAFNNTSVTLVYIPELPELDINDEEPIQIIAGVPTMNSEFSKDQKLGQLLKFFEDQIIAWIALVLLLPLILIIALLIKIESAGPVIFKQRRYGLGGKSFYIWKFRTMFEVESSAQFKQAQKDDPRITKVGKVLRRTSLDELPQLFNVITGSMSIVGPRPHPEKLNEQYRGDINRYMYRHASKPGITGLAQVKGYRGETIDPQLMELRVKYDLEYVRNWNLFLDFKILLLTFLHLITTDKAH